MSKKSQPLCSKEKLCHKDIPRNRDWEGYLTSILSALEKQNPQARQLEDCSNEAKKRDHQILCSWHKVKLNIARSSLEEFLKLCLSYNLVDV